MDAGVGCIGFIMLAAVSAFVVGVGLYLYRLRQINEQLQHSFANYRQSLEILKQQPNNPELRQRALEWGRHYSNLTRDNRGVTVYDEVALANDINAACAGGVDSARAAPTMEIRSIEHRLEQLKALFDKGAIGEQEYNERRSRLLDEV